MLIPEKIASALLERLNLFHYFQPTSILDIGCDTGYCLKYLQTLYPSARCFGLDTSHAKLKQAKENTHRWYLRPCVFMLGNIEKVLFVDQQFDLICANLSLLWISDLNKYLFTLKKLLKPNGLLLFTTLGPETFKEYGHNMPLNNNTLSQLSFCDMHHLGDMLVQHQFHDVVMDTSYFEVRYANRESAEQDIQHMGFSSMIENIQHDSKQTTLSASTVTWEVIYAQAWKLQNTTQALDTIPGEISIAFNRPHKK